MAGGGAVVVVGGGGGTPGGSSGQIQYNNAGAFGGIALGANNTVLTSNGSSASFAAPSGGGSLVLVEQHGGAAAAYNFTTGLTASYDTYMLVLSNIIPDTGTPTLNFQVSTNGGGAYINSAYYWSRWFWQTGGSSNGGSASDTSIVCSPAMATNGIYNGVLYIYNPLQSSTPTYITGQNVSFDGTNFNSWVHSGRYNTLAAINAFRIIPSGGGWTSGNARLYGVAKS